jgi:hypothetical protein
VRRLFEEDRLVPLLDVNLPVGWPLNSRRVPCQERRDEIHCRRFILMSDPCKDTASIIDSFNWHTFAFWASSTGSKALA